MLKKLKNNQGFTIIEVMIVLAIAALIILIVLLAVPALQRSSRNTSIKNDATTVSGGVSTYESNSSGALPKGMAKSGASVFFCSAVSDPTSATACPAGTLGSSVKVQGSDVVKFVSTGAKALTVTDDTNVGVIEVDVGFKCADSPSSDPVANPRSTVVQFVSETSGTPQNQCVDS